MSPLPRAAKFRLTAPDPLELEIHKVCADTLNRYLAPPAEWCCYPAGAAQLSPQQQARYARVGLKRGFPDLFVFYQGVYGLEIKRKGQGLSRTRVTYTRRGSPRILVGQEEMFPRLLASGGFKDIAIVRNVNELMKQLKAWDIPLQPGSELLL